MASKALWRSILDNPNTSDNEKILYLLESWNSIVSDYGLDWFIINQDGDTFKTQNFEFPEMSVGALWDTCSEAIGLYYESTSSLDVDNPNLSKEERRELKDEVSTLKDCQKALIKKYWNITYVPKKKNDPPVVKVDTPKKTAKIAVSSLSKKSISLKENEKAVSIVADYRGAVNRFYTINNDMDEDDLKELAEDLYEQIVKEIEKEQAERSKRFPGLNFNTTITPQDVVKYIWKNVSVSNAVSAKKLFVDKIFKPEYDRIIKKAIEEEKKLVIQAAKKESSNSAQKKEQSHSVKNVKRDSFSTEDKVPEPSGVRVESTIEIKLDIKSRDFDSDLLQSDINTLRSLLKSDDFYDKRLKIQEALGLDTEQYLVYNRDKQSEEVPIPVYALRTIIKNPKEPFYVVRDKDGTDHYIVSDSDYKRLQKEVSRATEPWHVERVIQNKEKQLNKNYKYINSNIGRRLISEGKSEQDVLDYVSDLKRKKRELDKKLAKAADRKLSDSRRKYGKEFRESLLRTAQKVNREQLAGLSFTGGVHKGKVPDVSKLMANVMNDVEKNMGKVKGAVAAFGTSQDISSKVFGQSGRAWRDEFNKVYTDEEKGYFHWEHIIYTVPVDIVPELEIEETYQIRAVLKPSIVKSKRTRTTIKHPSIPHNLIGKNLINNKKSISIKHDVDFGCLLAATYFYTLVSNTPVDEPYRKEVGQKLNVWDRPSFTVKDGKVIKGEEQLRDEISKNGTRIKRTRYRTVTHIPDEESVRGDWVLYFRGKTFKAYHSQPNKKGKSVAVDCYFTEDDFRNPITESSFDDIKSAFYNKNGDIKNTAFKPYIWTLAERIQKVVGDSHSDEYMPVVENLNPRWSILEYGRYKSEPNGPWAGVGTYGLPHGVTNKGFSYQAPMGFKRIVDAQYNAIITASAVYNKQKYGVDMGNASAYTRGNRALKWNIDITKAADPEYQLKHASTFEALFAQDNTLRVQNLHDINHETVWEYKRV